MYPETRARNVEGHVSNYKTSNAESALENKKPSFVSDTSSKTGVSTRVIHEELQIAKNILPEVQEVIKEKDIPKTQALKEGETTKPAQNLAEGINWANQIDLSPIRLY